MEDDLPAHVRDYRLETHSPKKRVVVHVYDDPDAPPSAPRRSEWWKSEKRPIGSGGQGQVFLQTCTSGGRLYTHRAVKVIPLQQGSARQRYLRELQTIVKFSHDRYSKYFVKSLGWYESHDYLCIAMEYLAKGDLETYLDKNPSVPEDECRHIIAQVATGLEHMHKEGFAHRDIKPGNVLIQQCPSDGEPRTWWVRLTDFGISKSLEAATSRVSTVVGTLTYMAPELFGLASQGSTSGVSLSYPAADMWALGVMAFRILIRTTLFANVGEVFQYKNHPDLVLPRTRLEDCDVTPDGAAFIRALLRPPPAERLTSNKALQHDWIRSLIPTALVILAAPSEASSSASSESSRESSFDEGRGMTTQFSDATNLPSRLQPGPSHTQPTVRPAPRGPTYKATQPFWESTVLQRHADTIVASYKPQMTPSPMEWDWKILQTLKGHTMTVSSIAFSPDGRSVVSASLDNTVRIWDIATGVAVQTLEGHRTGVRAVDFSPNSATKFWNIATGGATLRKIVGYRNMAISVAFSPNGQSVAFGTANKTVWIWNVATGVAVRTLMGHRDMVWSVGFSPDGRSLASASADDTVRIWNTATGATLHTLEDHKSRALSLGFSPDGLSLALGLADNTVRIWNTATGAALHTLEGHGAGVYSVTFSPDGRSLASASHDKTVRIWNIATGKILHKLEGHSNAVTSVAFSPDGRSLLVSAPHGTAIGIWNTTTGAILETLRGHGDIVESVAFSPDGRSLASTSEDGTISIWGGLHR